MISLRKLFQQGATGRRNPHKGRPGKVGGSLPEGGAYTRHRQDLGKIGGYDYVEPQSDADSKMNKSVDAVISKIEKVTGKQFTRHRQDLGKTGSYDFFEAKMSPKKKGSVAEGLLGAGLTKVKAAPYIKDGVDVYEGGGVRAYLHEEGGTGMLIIDISTLKK